MPSLPSLRLLPRSAGTFVAAVALGISLVAGSSAFIAFAETTPEPAVVNLQLPTLAESAR